MPADDDSVTGAGWTGESGCPTSPASAGAASDSGGGTAAGGAAAETESRRMVSEKFAAAAAARKVAAVALAKGKGIDTAASLALGPVKRAVRANHRRLLWAERFRGIVVPLRSLARRTGVAVGRAFKPKL